MTTYFDQTSLSKNPFIGTFLQVGERYAAYRKLVVIQRFTTLPQEHMRRSTYIKSHIMKTIATLIFILFIGVNAQAQTADETVKVDAIEMTATNKISFDEVSLKTSTEVARLYKRINTRVKKELTFSTKATRAKTA